MRCVNGRIVLDYIANRVYCQTRVPFFECDSRMPAVESTIAEFMTVKCTTIQFKIVECTESRVNRESSEPMFNSSESMCRVKITDNITRACN